MIIKEIEKLVNMTRANIRFYESEGMISPVRTDQGYRDYSLEDVATLKRIKLLRSLHLSLGDIKDIQVGRKGLIEVLAEKEKEIAAEQINLVMTLQVIDSIKKNHETYEQLNAPHYLEQLASENNYYDTIDDQLSVSKMLWQRFFARSIDFGLYQVLYFALFNLVFQINTMNNSFGNYLLSTFFIVIFTLIFEPICLHYFQTTLGKWCFGLRVSNKDKKALSYIEALKRTWGVLVSGYGFGIPIYVFFRLYLSAQLVKQNEILEWDESCRVSIKDTHVLRFACLPILYIIQVSLTFLMAMSCFLPPLRGSINTLQFVENRNALAKFHEMSVANLTDSGSWILNPNEYHLFIESLPDVSFIEENGELKQVSFSVHLKNIDSFISGYGAEMQLMILAFAGADHSFTPFTLIQTNMLEVVEKHQNDGFSFTFEKIEVTCIVNKLGMNQSGEILYPENEEENSFDLAFTMIKH